MWYPKLFALNMTEFLLEFDTMWAVLWSFYTYFLPLFSWGSLCFYSWYTADDLLQCFGFKFDMWTCWNMDFKSFHSYSFVVIQTCQHLQTGRKKKKPRCLALFSPPSLSFPSTFRVFAGGETRQNERMWDTQLWNGGQGPWGACVVYASGFWVHLYVMWACLQGKISYFPVLSCPCIHTEMQHILSLHESESQLNSTTRRKTTFETWGHSPPPLCNSVIPPRSFMNTHTHTHTSMFTSPFSTVPPWFPEQELCLHYCKGSVLLQQPKSSKLIWWALWSSWWWPLGVQSF